MSVSTEYGQTGFVGGCSIGATSAQYNPGRLTSGGATAATSQVINRPDEKVIMHRS
ncbi:hypothetical protein RP726_04965 [Candidatus Methylospira mobilis]|uniref:hypothetical protein n=1 Tax=Candidatus Methylospira mobilis TaxID=1808979 RepID=UPI001293B56D|nr:hypothetical protein [Candidatus Methylospira mobilis]WNV05773.1 hypothetical protein RP726_04965 [Candidatus Methylospira mobilis]